MPTKQRTAAEESGPFESLLELRAQHLEMTRTIHRNGCDEDVVDRIRQFIDRAKAIGTRLDSSADRDAAQNIITYWASYLFTAGDREALSAALPVLDPFDSANAPDLDKAACPYKALSAFGEEDAGGFFGRGDAVKTLLDRLREQPVVLVIGPMGSGKTSLVTAGVIPTLKLRMTGKDENPLFIVLLPGTDPFDALLRHLHEATAGSGLPERGAWISEQKKKLERSPQYLRTLLNNTFPGRPVFIVIDRFEEVFTLCSDPQIREKFAEALNSVCPSAQTPNRAILIIGESYQKQALNLAAFKPLDKNLAARFTVPPLTYAEALSIIESPAVTVGLKFDEGIVEDLAKDVEGQAGALPALQFTLGKLWNERERNRITWEAYRKVGTPREALQRTAEAVFENLSPEEQDAARKLFLRLVDPTVAGYFIRRNARRDALLQLDSTGAMAPVLEKYVEAGLIRRRPGANWDDDYFDVPHEALINYWPRLADWLQKWREHSETEHRLVETARLWQKSAYEKGYLLSGDALKEAEAYREAAPELAELIAASREAEDRRRNSRNLKCLLAALLLLLLVVVWQWNKAEEQHKIADAEAKASLDTLSQMLKSIHDQRLHGAITTTAAKGLLKPSKEIFASVEQRPGLAAARVQALINLVDVYFDAGNYPKALEMAKQAKEISEQNLNENRGNDAWQKNLYESAFRLGDSIEKVEHDRDRALEEYRLALQLAKQLAANDRTSEWQRNIAFIENKIGDIFKLLTPPNWREAQDHYEVALEVGERLVAKDPDLENEKTVGDARTRLGELYVDQKLWEDALEQCQIALSIRKRLAEQSPDDDVYQSNLSAVYRRMGDAYMGANRYEDARQQYQKTFEIKDRLAHKDPDNIERRDELIHVREKLGKLLATERQFDAALKEFNAALKIQIELAQKFSDNHDRQRNVASAYEQVGDALEARGEAQKSKDDLQEAREMYKNGVAGLEAFMIRNPGSGLESVRDNLQKKAQDLMKKIQPPHITAPKRDATAPKTYPLPKMPQKPIAPPYRRRGQK